MFIPFNAPAPDPELVKRLTAEQQELAQQVVLKKPSSKIKYIAGCDSSFVGDNILSVFVLLKYPEMEVVEKVWNYGPVELPYIPGFLAFREIPNLIKAYDKLQHKPDIIMVDGHGIAHPRRMGIATHLGVVLNKPTLGVAKKVLVGKFTAPEPKKGAFTPIMHKNELVANAVCTKDGIKPVFVSPGHLMDLATATDLAVKTSTKHKLPEPTWLADSWAEKFKAEVPQTQDK